MTNRIVFFGTIWMVSVYVAFAIGNQYQVKQCAIVPGETVVSSSDMMCYYVKSAYGRAVRGRKPT